MRFNVDKLSDLAVALKGFVEADEALQPGVTPEENVVVFYDGLEPIRMQFTDKEVRRIPCDQRGMSLVY